mgnify:CR=1 FL=1|tara:strand:- start:237 stop:929 length:693 start_codon:yes stop_codon:yes gene_type:complete
MNKKIMITGANRGIGLAITKQYIKRGEEVYAFCRNPNNSVDLNRLLNENKKINICKLDVCSEDSIKNATKFIKNYIDIIICNAGIGASYGGAIDEKNTQEKFLEVLNTNVVGPFLTIKYFLSKFNKKSDKKIAIISSLMGSQHHNSSNAYFYRSSKAAVNNLMVTFSNELIEQNISICSYHPGWVRTEMGGPNADISPEESAENLVNRFDEQSMISTGKFFNFDGKKLLI